MELPKENQDFLNEIDAKLDNEFSKGLINQGLKKVAQEYYDSPATTNAGRILRWIVRLIPVDIVVKIFAEKLGNAK